MSVRPYRAEDADALAELSAACTRTETDFVLNPMWESGPEVAADFARHGIAPEEHLLVAEGDDGTPLGTAGFLRRPQGDLAGLVCPVVARRARGRGTGGELLRAVLALGSDKLGIKLVTAGIGARNHAGYALLASQGFRPVRQHVLMRCDERPKGEPPAGEGLVFEPARSEDAAAIHALYEACDFEPRSEAVTQRHVGGPRHAHAVARRDGRVVGFVELETHWPERPWVAFVGVARNLRDRGVGSSLVGYALARQMEGGATSALLLLSPANRTAFRAYEKVGFRRHRMVDVLERRL